MSRAWLFSLAACSAIWVARPVRAQSSSDTLLFALPPAPALTCESESTAVPGARGYFFGVGAPSAQIRTSSGQLLAAGPPPREIAAVFDSAGHPIMLSDMVRPGMAIELLATVAFGREGRPEGFRQSITTDSAAVMARVQRDGLNALNAAIRENTRMGPREELDSLALRRARELADYLWGKRCP